MTKDLKRAVGAAKKDAKAKTRKMAEFKAETDGRKKKKDDELVKAATAAQKNARAKTQKMAEFRHEETEVGDDTLARGVAKAKRDLKAKKAVQTALRKK